MHAAFASQKPVGLIYTMWAMRVCTYEEKEVSRELSLLQHVQYWPWMLIWCSVEMHPAQSNRSLSRQGGDVWTAPLFGGASGNMPLRPASPNRFHHIPCATVSQRIY